MRSINHPDEPIFQTHHQPQQEKGEIGVTEEHLLLSLLEASPFPFSALRHKYLRAVFLRHCDGQHTIVKGKGSFGYWKKKYENVS